MSEIIKKIYEILKEEEKIPRILYTEYELHESEDLKSMVNSIDNEKMDIFSFKNFPNKFIVAKRMSIVVHHGRDPLKTIKVDLIDKVYAGHEKKIMNPLEYAKMINKIYKGA